MPETELSDSELIKAFGEGDHAAFETLYHRYRRQLYGFLSNLIPGNPAEVDEVFEETWLRVIDKLPKYRDDGKFSAWLFRVSRNLFIDRVRRNRPPGNGVLNLDAEEAPEIAGPASMSPERELDSADLERVIADAVGKLPQEQREVFLLRDVHGLSVEETAQALQIAQGTVKSRLARAREKIAAELKRRGVGQTGGERHAV